MVAEARSEMEGETAAAVGEEKGARYLKLGGRAS
jgi:hypothetical protein